MQINVLVWGTFRQIKTGNTLRFDANKTHGICELPCVFCAMNNVHYVELSTAFKSHELFAHC